MRVSPRPALDVLQACRVASILPFVRLRSDFPDDVTRIPSASGSRYIPRGVITLIIPLGKAFKWGPVRVWDGLFCADEVAMGTARHASLARTTASSSRAFLNSAHDRLATMFLAVLGDGAFVVGKSREIEYRLAPRRAKITAHPIGDHFLPGGV